MYIVFHLLCFVGVANIGQWDQHTTCWKHVHSFGDDS